MIIFKSQFKLVCSILCHEYLYFFPPSTWGWRPDCSGGRSGGLVFPSLKNFPQFVVIHIVKGFGVVNKAEVDVFLELFCFFNDPTDVGNLISGSSAFSKSRLNIWKFMVQVMLKPGLENFEHYFTSMWDECNRAVVWAFFGIAFLWDCLVLSNFIVNVRSSDHHHGQDEEQFHHKTCICFYIVVRSLSHVHPWTQLARLLPSFTVS